MKIRTIDNTGITVTVIKGETGADGYTPQKGIDYYTEEDKQEFIGSIEEYVANGYAPLDSNGLVPSKHLNNAVPHTTASGYPISLTDHLEGESVIDYKIYGNITQETRISKNLFSGFVKGVGLDWSTGAEITDSTWASSDYIAVDFNKNPNYTLDISTGSGFLYVYIYAYNSNKEYLGRHFVEYPNDIFNSSSFNINTTSNEGDIAYIRICAYEDSSGEDHLGTIDVIDTWMIQLEIGEISTEDIIYEPYGNMPSPEFPSEVESVGDLVTDETSEYYGKYDVPITVNDETKHIYLDEPLRKIGDYADYIDFKNQKVIRNVGVKAYDGSENWKNYPNNQGFSIIEDSMKSQNLGDGLCNYFKTVKKFALAGIIYGANSKAMYFIHLYASDSSLTVDEWKAKLSTWNTNGNPLTVYYILATSAEEDITIPNLTIPDSEVTNIFVGTSLQPSSMDVTYYQDINKVITELKNAILAQGGNV